MAAYTFETPRGQIKITIDEGSGMAYIYVAGEIPDKAVEIGSTLFPGLNIDQDRNGRVLGIEVCLSMRPAPMP